LIQACRRLYQAKSKKINLAAVVELNRRLMKGYAKHKNDPRIKHLRDSVMDYNRTLLQLNIRDHQVENASLPRIKVLGLIIYRLGKLLVLSIAVLPGLVLFSPVFIAGKLISNQKSKEALAASSVKLQGNDVMATWKLIVSLVLAPALYILYDLVFGVILWQTGFFEYLRSLVPGIIRRWTPQIFVYSWYCFFFICSLVGFGSVTYAALRFGEIGMDIAKSLRPLFVALSPHHGHQIARLRERRRLLAVKVTEVINEFGPEMFPDFPHDRIIPDSQTMHRWELESSGEVSEAESTPSSPASPSTGRFNLDQSNLPRNESLHDLSSIGVFASRPTTPYHHRSRSRSNSFGGGLQMHAFSPLENKAARDEIDGKVKGEDITNELTKRQTGRSRRRSESGSGYNSEDSDASSSGVLELKGRRLDGLTMTKGKKE
jgi:glycerol-3-phosphate O-acyltransferase / dihydroxyacetone phosphate acyltransferase